ncbi:hypothetical protein [Propionimicrobium sp. PCR01-08-3]|uniref:hypothetical protein n=1 Tax=Propionimicrobium sp. PCR01-08-3 TaxID=3052086 RepID=UPI00255C7588|nr:hypothetical protein [Propionimicrobium sp. PCR01-08-3]WIY83814.1 hypothetical protein QQ658_05570 [Propionimicrobium sp. PCR01-08-3]
MASAAEQGHVFDAAVWVCLSAGVVCAVVAAALDQIQGLVSVLGAVTLVLGYFWGGQAVQRYALRLANSQGMMVIIIGYLVRVAALGIVLLSAHSFGRISTLVSTGWVAAGSLSAIVGWLGGLIFAHSRARIPVYDRPYVAPQGRDA